MFGTLDIARRICRREHAYSSPQLSWCARFALFAPEVAHGRGSDVSVTPPDVAVSTATRSRWSEEDESVRIERVDPLRSLTPGRQRHCRAGATHTRTSPSRVRRSRNSWSRCRSSTAPPPRGSNSGNAGHRPRWTPERLILAESSTRSPPSQRSSVCGDETRTSLVHLPRSRRQADVVGGPRGSSARPSIRRWPMSAVATWLGIQKMYDSPGTS